MGRGADEKLVAACRDPKLRESAIRRAERHRLWELGGFLVAASWFGAVAAWDLGPSALAIAVFAMLFFEIRSARETADLRLLRFSAILDERGATPGPTPPPADRRVGGR